MSNRCGSLEIRHETAFPLHRRAAPVVLSRRNGLDIDTVIECTKLAHSSFDASH